MERIGWEGTGRKRIGWAGVGADWNGSESNGLFTQPGNSLKSGLSECESTKRTGVDWILGKRRVRDWKGGYRKGRGFL